jgi:hypothetical protein
MYLVSNIVARTSAVHEYPRNASLSSVRAVRRWSRWRVEGRGREGTGEGTAFRRAASAMAMRAASSSAFREVASAMRASLVTLTVSAMRASSATLVASGRRGEVLVLLLLL